MPFTELGETEKQLCGEIKNSVLDTRVLSLEGEMREQLNLLFWECFRIGSQWGREGLRWGDWGSEGKSEDACSYW